MKKIPLLDLGNVVIQVDFRPFLARLAEGAGEGKKELVSQLLGSSLFFDFEFGAISRTEFTKRINGLYAAHFSQAELEESFCGIFPGLVEGIRPAMEELAAAGPIYALSNTNEVHLEWLVRNHPGVMGLFTKVFASHELGARKPYPGIYREVARRIGVEPGSLAFFDDVPANVAGARRAGLEAHLFTETGQLRSWLRELKEIQELGDEA